MISHGHEFSSTDRHEIQLTRTILANYKATAETIYIWQLEKLNYVPFEISVLYFLCIQGVSKTPKALK